MPELFKPEPIVKVESDEAWHARRAICVGASEIAVLFGCHPYLTPNKLYHVKKGTGADSRRNDKALTNFGNTMEPIIANLVADKTGWTLQDVQEHWIHPDHPFLGATIDRFIVESERGPGILQIKNVSPFSPGWSETRAPDYVEYQVQQELMIGAALHGIKWACIGALMGGNPDDVRIMVRTLDEKVAQKIQQRGAKFWQMVEDRNEPKVTADDFDHISDMFKQAEDRKLAPIEGAPEGLEDLAREWEICKETEAGAKKATEEAKTRLLRAAMQDMGDHMERDRFFVGEEKTVEFKLIEMKESVSTRAAHTQIRITVKDKPEQMQG